MRIAIVGAGAIGGYLGAELARAEIAWQLGKRYAQDEELDWGVAAERPRRDLSVHHAPGATLRARAKEGSE